MYLRYIIKIYDISYPPIYLPVLPKISINPTYNIHLPTFTSTYVSITPSEAFGSNSHLFRGSVCVEAPVSCLNFWRRGMVCGNCLMLNVALWWVPEWNIFGGEMYLRKHVCTGVIINVYIYIYIYTCDLQNPFFSVWTPKYVFLQFVGENSLRAKFPIRAKLFFDDRKMELHFAFSHFVEKKNSGETWCNSGVIRCKSGETSRTTVFWAISS